MSMVVEIVVPALALRTSEGCVDLRATADYARRGAATWVDRFILSGTTTRGRAMSVAERTAVLDLWLDSTASRRLLACCWSAADIEAAVERHVTPIVVMQGLDDRSVAASLLETLPPGSFVYSHPAHSRIVLDAGLCAQARVSGSLPAGAKLAKVTTGDIVAMRDVVGPDFALWDASSRDIAASAGAGASGVVATPLSPFAAPFPPRQQPILQRVIDRMQAKLDQLPSREARGHHLANRARFENATITDGVMNE